MIDTQIKANIPKDCIPQKRFIQRAKQMGIVKNKKWLTRLISKDKIGYLKESGRDSENIRYFEDLDKQSFIFQLFTLIDLFDGKYGKSWDLNIDYSSACDIYYLSFMIHYPELTITNSENLSKDLKDLIVVLPLSWHTDTKNLFFTTPRGTRLTLFHDEWVSRYQHSHLRSVDVNVSNNIIPQTFCIGTEDVSNMLTELSLEDFDTERYLLFLFTLDNMVAWESLEGTPHRHMDGITFQEAEQRLTHDIGNLKSLYSMFISRVEDYFNNKYSFNYIFSEGRFKVKHDTRFEEFVKEVSIKSSFSEHLLCKRGQDGYFYRIPDNQMQTTPKDYLKSLKERSFVYIQGKRIEFDIINVNLEQKVFNQDEYIIYPQFLNYVSEQLEIQLYESCVKGAGIYRLSNSNRDVATSVGQNQVFM